MTRKQKRKSIGNNLLALAGVFLAFQIVVSGPVSAQVGYKFPDTAQNRARGVAGCTQTSTGIQCPNRVGATTSSYSDAELQQALETALRPAFDAMGYMLRDFLFGNPAKEAAKEAARQRQIAENKRRLRMQYEARLQKDAAQKRKFVAARNRLMGIGVPGGLAPRDLMEPASKLSLEEKRGAFGTIELRPRDFSGETLRPRRVAGIRPLSAMESARCASHIMKLA